jgi:phosphoglycerol transferase MdoB-like AlkP superfamily enzyme
VPTVATIVAVCGAFGILVSLTRRPLTALLLSAYLLAVILITSAVKQRYLETPLTLADLQFFFLEPLENLKLFVNYPMFAASIAALLLLGAGIIVAGLRLEPLRWPFAPLRPRHALLVSAVGATVVAIAVGSLAASHASHPGRADEGDAYAAFLALRRMEQADGLIERLNVFFENRDMLAILPPPRAQHRFPGAPAREPGVASTDRRPDILVVLEESTFDPALIAKCRFLACNSPMFRAPSGSLRTQEGPLVVHTTGGGTWLSEFAFLSGFDWRIFGRGGAYAPVSLAPRLTTSLPMYLRSLNYRTVVISAVDADFLRARSGYRDYGFDEFYAARELQLPADWYAVRDALVFAKALALVDRTSDRRPVFAYILTIRNHGPHGDRDVATPQPLRLIEQRLGRPLADYLGRLDDSTQDFAQLRRRWLQSDRPRVIGWFGDHQPEFVRGLIDTVADVNPERLTHNAAARHLGYLTYYQLSANFGGPLVTSSPDALDISFLGEELLSFAGLPLDAGSVAARDVASSCRGLLFDCADSELINSYFAYRIHDLRTVR